MFDAEKYEKVRVRAEQLERTVIHAGSKVMRLHEILKESTHESVAQFCEEILVDLMDATLDEETKTWMAMFIAKLTPKTGDDDGNRTP